MLSALRKRSSGFTLLELIIVVVVIGILASIALPRYLKVTEKSRVTEAKNLLGAIRASQVRYAAQYSLFATGTSALDLPNTTFASSGAAKYFTFGLPTSGAVVTDDTVVVAFATRTNADVMSGLSGYILNITAGGTIGSADARTDGLY